MLPDEPLAVSPAIHRLSLDATDEARCHCGELYREDFMVRQEAAYYVPGRVIRQWRCLNGHSVTLNRGFTRQRGTLRRVVCDTCSEAFETYNALAVRHAACHWEADRQRKTPGGVPMKGRASVAP